MRHQRFFIFVAMTCAAALRCSIAQTMPASAPASAPISAPGDRGDAAVAARLRALIAASGGATASSPSTAPTSHAAAATTPTTTSTSTSSSTTLAAKPMPEEYALLKTRSIFLKGRAPLAGSGSPTTRETPKRLEDLLVFNGATINDVDGQAIGFIEDTSSPGKVMRVRVGDALAHGKVVKITLSQLDYEAAGKVATIDIGHALSGVAVSGSGATSMPSGSVAPDPNEDPIITRMRRAREEGR